MTMADVTEKAVETATDTTKEVVAGDAALALSALKGKAELLFSHPVHHAKLLLLIEADAVFGHLAARGLTVDTWRVWTALFTLGGGENILTEATVKLRGRTGVTRHGILGFGISGGLEDPPGLP